MTPRTLRNPRAGMGLLAAACLSAFLTASAGSTNQVQIALEALRRAEATRLEGWGFTATTVSEGRRTIERHDPSLSKGHRWQLLLKDDEVPREKQLRRYAEERKHRGAGSAGVRDTVDETTLTLVSEDVDRLTYGFQPKFDEDEKRIMEGKIRGKLVVLREGPTVESLQVTNTARISKAGILSMSEFRTSMRFRRDTEHDATLLESLSVRIRGRALLVKSIDQDIRTEFSDHKWMGEAKN